MARFSVIVPAFNAERTIGLTIESVLAQSDRDLELIVVDDGSTDETPEVIRSLTADPRLSVIRQANQGTAGARNTGIAIARGEYVAFLDNDDLWLPNYVDAVRRAFEARPRAGLAYTDAYSLDDESGRIKRATTMARAHPPPDPPQDPAEFLELLAVDNFILSSATVRRSVLERVGGFDPMLTGVDDYDLWLRILAAGYAAVRTPRPLVIQRDHPGSQSKDSEMMVSNLGQMLAKRAEQDGLPPPVREILSRRVEETGRELALLRGELPVRRGLLRLRLLAGGLWRSLTETRRFYDEPPPEVAAAFPNLARKAATQRVSDGRR